MFIKQLPSPYNLGKVNYPLSTHIYDRKGRVLYEVYKLQNRTPVRLNDLPWYVSKAIVAIEDKDFYTHKGISPTSGILRALRDMLMNKNLQGGSTITQQLIKTALLTPERTVLRKVKELILAIQTERIFSKHTILELYINQVPYGGAAYGIEEAAKMYFDKHASELTIEEAALLAGLPQAPSLYSPFFNPPLAVKRRNEVLQKMYEQGYIDKKSKIKYQKSTIAVKSPSTPIKAPHFVFHVKEELSDYFGLNQVDTGGFIVTTTLDLDIQKEAEAILKEELAKIQYLNISNGAILITRPSTGEILAMVGSVDYFASPSGSFNVAQAQRQPGSAVKPLMYSLALQRGYTAATILDDTPVVFFTGGSEPYRPVNYDGAFHGKMPLRYALANSYNVPAVKVFQTIGVTDFIDHSSRMGITTWVDPSQYGLSLTLGGGEVTLLDMSEAFGVFANRGNRIPISGILRVTDIQNKPLDIPQQSNTKVLDEGVAYIISDILSDHTARQWAFGTQSFLEIPRYKVAVKTGTTDSKKDNWTIGYTPEFLVAVWVGNNDNTPMHPYLASGITGAAPIWNRMMRYLLENYTQEKTWFNKPDNVIEKRCYFGRVEYFIKGTENFVNCDSWPGRIEKKQNRENSVKN